MGKGGCCGGGHHPASRHRHSQHPVSIPSMVRRGSLCQAAYIDIPSKGGQGGGSLTVEAD